MATGLAERVIAALSEDAATLAVAESLTGGLVGARLTAVPGASAVFRGGVIAYAAEVKAEVLGVDSQLLARSGAVHVDVAAQMASGVRRLLDATHGLALTGVAGPGGAEGKVPGTVHVAVSWPGGARVESPELTGYGRAEIREHAADAAMRLLLGVVRC